MKRKTLIFLAGALALLASCGTPKEIAYFQDITGETSLKSVKAETIRLQPFDKISVIVNSRDPQVAAMFNLPYYTKRLGDAQSLTSNSNIASSQTGLSGYTVDSDGCIDFPVLGKILVAGLTREEAEERIKEELLDSRQIKDPVVTIEFMNLGFSIIGEVAKPGRYKIDRDRFTVLDAISLAGDLTINGRRDNVMLVRHEVTKDRTYMLNLMDAKSLYSSPAFYMEQGDIIYVTPNDKRIRESTVNGNNVRSTSFWISLTSLLTSVALLVFNILTAIK
ncbi:MAG: polysaccharide biosynthesis/export family protein [Bacteroidales bacterium]|nr:polysaccharide biosynthesis/export family protein [Bacteroidales bacterium]